MPSSPNFKNTIAFPGTLGSYGDLACRQRYPYMITLPCASIEEIYAAVKEERASLGLIPMTTRHGGERSLMPFGTIQDLWHHSDLYIVGEYFHTIEHYLWGIEGAEAHQLHSVYSHPHILEKCASTLESLAVIPVASEDPAHTAKQIAEWKDASKSVIASPLAGEMYHLKCLKKDMNDSEKNDIFFHTVAKDPIDPEEGILITALFFTTRNVPAALYKTLGGFATNAVNILSIESVNSDNTHHTASFFLTILGNPHEKSVQLALEELGFFSNSIKIIGAYHADPRRFEEK